MEGGSQTFRARRVVISVSARSQIVVQETALLETMRQTYTTFRGDCVGYFARICGYHTEGLVFEYDTCRQTGMYHVLMSITVRLLVNLLLDCC